MFSLGYLLWPFKDLVNSLKVDGNAIPNLKSGFFFNNITLNNVYNRLLIQLVLYVIISIFARI